MNKRAIFEHYSYILDSLIDNSVFWSVYFEQPYGLDTIYGDEEDNSLPSSVTLAYGATRACLIDDNEDWVVKFDVSDDGLGSCCDREVDIFRAAESAGLERYFADAIFLGVYEHTINSYEMAEVEQKMDWYGYDEAEFERRLIDIEDQLTVKRVHISIPLYAYPRATECEYPFLTDEEQRTISSRETPLNERSIAVAGAFIEEYGMDSYNELCEFCVEHRINDLHMGNIGVTTYDNRLVLIDFSGYHEGCTEEEEDDTFVLYEKEN